MEPGEGDVIRATNINYNKESAYMESWTTQAETATEIERNGTEISSSNETDSTGAGNSRRHSPKRSGYSSCQHIYCPTRNIEKAKGAGAQRTTR